MNVKCCTFHGCGGVSFVSQINNHLMALVTRRAPLYSIEFHPWPMKFSPLAVRCTPHGHEILVLCNKHSSSTRNWHTPAAARRQIEPKTKGNKNIHAVQTHIHTRSKKKKLIITDTYLTRQERFVTCPSGYVSTYYVGKFFCCWSFSRRTS